MFGNVKAGLLIGTVQAQGGLVRSASRLQGLLELTAAQRGILLPSGASGQPDVVPGSRSTVRDMNHGELTPQSRQQSTDPEDLIVWVGSHNGDGHASLCASTSPLKAPSQWRTEC